jgi:hypothetical protein
MYKNCYYNVWVSTSVEAIAEHVKMRAALSLCNRYIHRYLNNCTFEKDITNTYKDEVTGEQKRIRYIIYTHGTTKQIVTFTIVMC